MTIKYIFMNFQNWKFIIFTKQIWEINDKPWFPKKQIKILIKYLFMKIGECCLAILSIFKCFLRKIWKVLKKLLKLKNLSGW